MVKHELASGEYNKRRADCEEAARVLGVNSLRDITVAAFEQRQDELDERLRIGAPLATWNSSTIYKGGANGYIDYPTLQQEALGTH